VKKLLTVTALTLLLIASVVEVTTAKNNNCPQGGCLVQIKNSNIDPPCPAGIFVDPMFRNDTIGCPRIVNGQAGSITLTWTGLNASVCFFSYPDPNAVTTNGIASVAVAGVNGTVNGNEVVPIFLTEPNYLVIQIKCRGLAQNNELNSVAITAVTIKAIL